ncbi:MAG: energy transducer TonB [Bacteroidia bacterium]
MNSPHSKNDRIDSQRGIFFQLGLVISILSVIIFMNFTYSVKKPEAAEEPVDPPTDFNAKVTIIEKEERKPEEPEPTKEQQKIYDPDKIKIVEKKAKPSPDSIVPLIDTSMFSIYKEPKPDDEPVPFDLMEDKPAFPDGEEGLYKFMGKNIKYPPRAKRESEQGTVVVYFIIEKDGSVGNIKILKSVSPEIYAEAIRVLKLMPNWSPGRQRGEYVRVSFIFPLKFSLQ